MPLSEHVTERARALYDTDMLGAVALCVAVRCGPAARPTRCRALCSLTVMSAGQTPACTVAAATTITTTTTTIATAIATIFAAAASATAAVVSGGRVGTLRWCYALCPLALWLTGTS